MSDESNTALETLDRWWADAPAGQPSLPQIAETRTRIRRRRRRTYLAAGALAAVMAGAVVFNSTSAPQTDRDQQVAKDPANRSATDAPTAAPGYRLEAFQVDSYTVVVEVPESWGRIWNGCGGGAEPKVQQSDSATVSGRCPRRGDGLMIETGLGPGLRSLINERDLGGVMLKSRPVICGLSDPPVCGALATMTSNDVLTDGPRRPIQLTAQFRSMDAPEVLDHLLASARIVPSGYVAVPQPARPPTRPERGVTQFGEALRAAGLNPEEIQADCGSAALCVTGLVVDVSPAPGSIVAKGSTVTVSHY